MKTTMKLTIAACGLIATLAAPPPAAAETYTSSEKVAYGHTWGTQGNLSLAFSAFANVRKSKTSKEKTFDGWLSGEYMTDTECWIGDGYTEDVDIKTTLQPPIVTASGSTTMTWYDCTPTTGIQENFTETVTFDIELTPLTTRMSSYSGTTHEEHGSFKAMRNYNYSSARASTNASTMTSPAFGTVRMYDGETGQSRTHMLSIYRGQE